MTEVKHTTRMLRIAPRKLRLVADRVRYLEAEKAISILELVVNKGALMVQKSLKSAITNATALGLDPSSLVVQQVWCDEGPKLKRLVIHSRGRSAQIQKKYSHLNLVLKGENKPKARLKAVKSSAE